MVIVWHQTQDFNFTQHTTFKPLCACEVYSGIAADPSSVLWDIWPSLCQIHALSVAELYA